MNEKIKVHIFTQLPHCDGCIEPRTECKACVFSHFCYNCDHRFEHEKMVKGTFLCLHDQTVKDNMKGYCTLKYYKMREIPCRAVQDA